MKIRLLLAAIVASSLSLTASPAYAADREVDKGWIKLQCAGDGVREKCHIRVPEGFSELNINFFYGSQWQGTDTTYGSRHYKPYSTPRNARIGGAVSIFCSQMGSIVDCDVRMRSTIDMLNLNLWADKGWYYGGVKWSQMLG